MCGIVGVFTTRPSRELRQMFKRMLAYDSVRGTNSTGVFTVNADGTHPDLHKTVLPGYSYIVDKTAQEILNNPKAGLLLGHNRASTRGSAKPANAHPFWIQGEEGDIVLVHNGTLYNYRELPAAGDFEVDSEAIANSICVQGLAKTLDAITGSYALVWYDLRAKTLNFYRETARPMHLLSMDKQTLVFSSQVDIAMAAAAAEGLELKYIGEVEPWHHHVFQWDNPTRFTKTEVDARERQVTGRFTGRFPGRFIEDQGSNYSPAKAARTSNAQGGSEGKVVASVPPGTVKALTSTPRTMTARGAIWERFKSKEVEFLVCDVKPSRRGRSNEVSGVMMSDPFYTVIGYDSDHIIKDGDIVKGTVSSMGPGTTVELYVVKMKVANRKDDGNKFVGPGGIILTEERWHKYTKNGCMGCKTRLMPGDRIHWWNLDPVCDDCFDADVFGSYYGDH